MSKELEALDVKLDGIEMTKEEFHGKWKEQSQEWDRIKDEWIELHEQFPESRETPTAWHITEAQKRRARKEGRELLDFARIWIIGMGWLIPREFGSGPKAGSNRKEG